MYIYKYFKFPKATFSCPTVLHQKYRLCISPIYRMYSLSMKWQSMFPRAGIQRLVLCGRQQGSDSEEKLHFWYFGSDPMFVYNLVLHFKPKNVRGESNIWLILHCLNRLVLCCCVICFELLWIHWKRKYKLNKSRSIHPFSQEALYFSAFLANLAF